MLSTTVVYACRHGGSERLQKNGHPQRGAQRALYLDCQRAFTLSPKGPRDDQKFKDQVVAAYQERMSTRGIKRTFGVCDQTLMVWVGEKGGDSAHVRAHAFARSERRRARVG